MSNPPIALTPAPDGYTDWWAQLKGRINAAQQRATLAVNRELVSLYWQIGRDILARQAEQGWGAKAIEHLAHDLRTAFLDMKGFSARNLEYMRAFAEAWPDERFVQEVLAQLPWYHQVALLDKLPGPETRRRYVAKAIEHGWSRNVLVMQIESRLLERSGPSGAARSGRRGFLHRPALLSPEAALLHGDRAEGGEVQARASRPARLLSDGGRSPGQASAGQPEHRPAALASAKTRWWPNTRWATDRSRWALPNTSWSKKSLPAELQTDLPSIEQIERELAGNIGQEK